MNIKGKEVKSIVIRDKNDDDIIHIGNQETINKTDLKVKVTFLDGTTAELVNGLKYG